MVSQINENWWSGAYYQEVRLQVRGLGLGLGGLTSKCIYKDVARSV